MTARDRRGPTGDTHGAVSGDDGRGQAAVIGIVLLVGLVAIGGIGILLIGGQIQEESRERAELARVEQGFLELGRDVNSVSRSAGEERVINLELPDTGEAALQEDRAGRIWVNRTKFSTGTTDVLVDQQIGAIRYEGRGETFAYQAGAVFRGSGQGTQVLSNPGFDYGLNQSGGSPTLTLPIVTTVGPDSLPSGTVRARKVDTQSPVNDDTIVENDLVTVTVQSEWYVGWAAYFRTLAEKTGVPDIAVQVDHTRQTATLELIVPVDRPSVGAGVVGVSGADDFDFDNNIALDSYDSRDGDYQATKTSDIDVTVAGNLTFDNSITIDGDVEVGGHLQINNNPTITGNASYGTADPDPPDAYVDGWTNNNATVTNFQPIDSLIDARAVLIRTRSTNSGGPISNGTLDGCASTCTLSAGDYYLEELHLGNGDELRFEPGTGEINVVVNGTVELSKARIELDGGDGRVNVFVNSEQPGVDDILIDQSKVIVPGNDSTRLWWYGDSDGNGTFAGGDTVFHGVVFGPGSSANPGFDVTISNSGEYYGALVADVNSLGNNMALHYDKALTQAETITDSTTVPRLTFLVVTSYVVEVEGD